MTLTGAADQRSTTDGVVEAAGGTSTSRKRTPAERVDDLFTIGALIAALAIMFLTTGDASGRYLLNTPIQGAFEVTENYLLILAVFLAVGYGYRRDVYVRVTFFVNRFGGGARRTMDCVAHAISILAGLALVYASARQVMDTIASGVAMSGLLAWILWPAYAVLLLGVTWMTTLMVLDVPRVWKYGLRGDREDTAVV